MFSLLCSLIRLLVRSGHVREAALENLALRQQLTVFKRHRPRPRLEKADRLFWLLLSRAWKDWQRALIIVKPESGSIRRECVAHMIVLGEKHLKLIVISYLLDVEGSRAHFSIGKVARS